MRSFKTVNELFNETYKPLEKLGDWMQGYRDAEAGVPHKDGSDDYNHGYGARIQHEANMGAIGR